MVASWCVLVFSGAIVVSAKADVVIAPSNANERGCKLNLLITRVPKLDEKKETNAQKQRKV